MAPPPITEDYYMILGVEQTAEHQLIVNSYRRLALKLHPDKNAGHDTTEAFQKLGRAYETLKDESTRRAYDLIYPSIKRDRRPAQHTKAHCRPHDPVPRPGTSGEEAQIAAIEKAREERSARWRISKNAFESSIWEIQRKIRRLEQEISLLDRTLAAEAASEAWNNSWKAWFLSPIYKKPEDSQEEKERKDRARQERRIEKDLKDRRKESIQTQLRTQETLLKKAKNDFDAADRGNVEKILIIKAIIEAREYRERQERQRQEREKQEKERQKREKERQERERQERETMAAYWKQQQEQWEKSRREAEEARKKQQEQWEKSRREAEEAVKKQQEEQRAAEQRWYENRAYTYANTTRQSDGQAYTSACVHNGWWPKVQGRTACPECFESWTYLLECPSCMMKACPRCQARIRPRLRQNPKTKRNAFPRHRTPSPDYGYDYWD